MIDKVRPKSELGALTILRERKQFTPTVKTSAEDEVKTDDATYRPSRTIHPSLEPVGTGGLTMMFHLLLPET